MLLRSVILFSMLPACGSLSATAAGPSSLASRNATAARTAFAVLDQRDFGRFEALHTKDFVKHYNNAPTETLAEEMQDARRQFVASTDLRFSVNWVVAEGDRVAVSFTGRGTHDGPLGKIAATGRKFDTTGMTVWRFVDGLIAEEWVFFNDLDLLRQFGLASL